MRFRPASLLWTFTSAFLVVLVLGIVLQFATFFAVVRPAARHWAQSQGEVMARSAAREVGQTLERNPAAQIDPILASVTRRSGLVILIYRDEDGRVVAADRPLGARRRDFFQQFLRGPGQEGIRRFGRRDRPDSARGFEDRRPAGPEFGGPARIPGEREPGEPQPGEPQPGEPRPGEPQPGEQAAGEPPERAFGRLGPRVPPELAVRAAVQVGGRPAGEVVAFIPPREALRWPEGTPRPWLLFLPIAALLAGGAGFILFRILARRLGRLEEQAERVAAGDLEARIADPGRDEVGRLGQSLNRMTSSLAEARRSVEEADRQRRRFLADVTHELSTPLTSIRGFAETLCDPAVPVSVEERQTYLKDILDEARRMDLLIADLLDLARMEAGAAEFERTDLNWVDLCRESLRRFQPFFDDRKIALRWIGGSEPAEPVRVRADGRRLEQVLSNLLTNALRYVPRGGTVEISLARATDGAGVPVGRLVLQDNGPGFAAADLPHIFDRFYRADPSRAAEGTGLGLAIAREIVRAQGGAVRAENRAEGGARLVVEMPLAP